MDLEKLASLLNEDVDERAAEAVQGESNDEPEKTASAADATESSNDDDEATMKVASELFAMGDIIASGFVNHLANRVKEANNPSPDAGDGDGAEGSIAKNKGDALPQNAAPMPADESGKPLKEEGLRNAGPIAGTKGDSQGEGMGEGGGKTAGGDKAVLDRLARALRG